MSALSYIIIFSIAISVNATNTYYQRFGNRDEGTGDSIPIGLISDQNTEQMQKVFERAIEIANIGLEIPLRSISINREINYGNSLQAYFSLCDLLEAGVAAIYGPSSKNAAIHLMNVCDAKEVPYVYSYMESDGAGKSSINLHPPPSEIAQALHDLIGAYEWTRFTFLYESAEYLDILNAFMELYTNGGPTITVRRYDLKLNGNYRSVLRRLRKSPDTQVVVVGSTESMPEFFRQAQQIGIIHEDYKYIFASLDLQSIDLEDYKHSEANITGIRMFSPDQPQVKDLMIALGYHVDVGDENNSYRNVTCPITIEMALLYDGVQLFAETTNALKFRPNPLNCSDESSVWDKGYSFRNYMALAAANGLTGRISFGNGVRNNYNLEIVELTGSGIAKIGTWNANDGLEVQRLPITVSLIDSDQLSLVNKTFKVLLALSPPYAMLKKSTVKLNGNDRYEGYGIELIQRLAEKLGFNFTFILHKDDNYGIYNVTLNVSTGMVHEIMEGRADLAVTDLTISSDRESGVDFTIPFMNLGISILYQKPRKAPPALFSFMDPFSSEVWFYLGLAYFGVSLSLFILGRISPVEWDNPYPCIEEPTHLENQFSIGNAMWFTTGALLQQGSEIAPKAPSTRTIASMWWFFTMIMVSSYTANLAAFLTVEIPTNPIENVKDLAYNQVGIKYGAKKKGSTRNFFLTSEEETYRVMNEYMIANDYQTESNDIGVQRVLNDNYAFLMESTSIEYNVARHCNLTQIGGLLDEKGYGIAMRKNWPYRDKLNNALLELQESGVLSRMKSKWWTEVGTGGCATKKEQSEAEKLGMDNLGGVYLVLVVGCCTAMTYGIVEWLIFVYKKARQYKVRYRDALRQEFRFVINFSNYTRILKGPSSTYSRSRNSSISIESIEPETNSK